MDAFLITVAAGVLSTVIATLLIHWLGGGAPPRHGRPGRNSHNSSTIDGDNNVVNQEDYSHTEVNHFRQVVHQHQARQDPSEGNDDTWLMTGGAALLGVVVALGFLLVWHVVVWVVIGAGIGVALAVGLTYVATRGTSGPRVSVVALTVGSAACLFLSAWWLSHGGPGSSMSLPDIETAVVDRFPAFGEGFTRRADVLLQHPREVVEELGMSTLGFLLTQIITLEVTVLLVLERAREVIGWRAYRQVQAGRHESEKFVARAEHFFQVNHWTWLVFIILAAAALLASGGWLATWLTTLQSQAPGV